jgi:hypothetical protein
LLQRAVLCQLSLGLRQLKRLEPMLRHHRRVSGARALLLLLLHLLLSLLLVRSGLLLMGGSLLLLLLLLLLHEQGLLMKLLLLQGLHLLELLLMMQRLGLRLAGRSSAALGAHGHRAGTGASGGGRCGSEVLHHLDLLLLQLGSLQLLLRELGRHAAHRRRPLLQGLLHESSGLAAGHCILLRKTHPHFMRPHHGHCRAAARARTAAMAWAWACVMRLCWAFA